MDGVECVGKLVGRIDFSGFPLGVSIQLDGSYLCFTYSPLVSHAPGVAMLPGDTVTSRAWIPPKFDNETRALEWILRRLRECVVHEVDEMFLYKGKQIFDPHDPSKALSLWSLS